MFDHQQFQDIKQALSVKSTLQEINERVLLDKTPEPTVHSTTLTLKGLNTLTGQILPGRSSQTISLDFLPKANTIIMLPHTSVPVQFAAVKPSLEKPDELEIHPAPPKEIQQMINKGYTVADRDQHAFDMYKQSLRYRLKLPVFFESAERLIYRMFSSIFLRMNHEYSKDVYVAELILIVVLAVIAVVSLWVIAVLVS